MKGILTCGFEFDIPEENLDNMELIDALSEVTDDNQLAISKVATLMLGKKQKKKLYDHLRNEKGRVPIKDATDALIEILNFNQKGKN